MGDQRAPSRASFVQYVEFGLLKRMTNDDIEFVMVGSTAAYAYGLDVQPKDVDMVVAYERETRIWQFDVPMLPLCQGNSPRWILDHGWLA